MTTLAHLFWDWVFLFSPVWFVQGHLISQLLRSFMPALEWDVLTEKVFLRSPDYLQGWCVHHHNLLFPLHADCFLVSASSLFCSYSLVFILHLSYKCHNNDKSIIWYSLATFNFWLNRLWAIPPKQGSSADSLLWAAPHFAPFLVLPENSFWHLVPSGSGGGNKSE